MRTMLLLATGLALLGANPTASKAEEPRLELRAGFYNSCGFNVASPFSTVSAAEVNPAAPGCCRVHINIPGDKIMEACLTQGWRQNNMGVWVQAQAAR